MKQIATVHYQGYELPNHYNANGGSDGGRAFLSHPFIKSHVCSINVYVMDFGP